MGGGVSTNHKSSNRIELFWLGQDWLNFKSFDLTPPIDPPIQPPTHTPTHGWGVSTNHKSSNRIELSWFSQHFLNFSCFDLTPPINPPTHPPNHIPNHGWGILYRFQIFKWNWNVLISSSVIKFLLILGSPLGVVDGWMGWGWVWVCGGCPMHGCTHMHAHACMHAQAC